MDQLFYNIDIALSSFSFSLLVERLQICISPASLRHHCASLRLWSTVMRNENCLAEIAGLCYFIKLKLASYNCFRLTFSNFTDFRLPSQQVMFLLWNDSLNLYSVLAQTIFKLYAKFYSGYRKKQFMKTTLFFSINLILSSFKWCSLTNSE